MASTAITLSEVKKNLALLLGISRDPLDWDADTASDVERIIRSGRRKFAAAHEWRHLEQPYRVVVDDVYDTGTVTVVDGVVTVSSGTLPTDTADYVFLPDDGGVYEIDTRDSATEFTLVDTTLDLDALTEYEIRRVHFPLPDGFIAFLGPITIENTLDGEVLEVPVLPEWTVRGLGSRQRAVTDRPELVSVYHTVDAETGVFTPYFTIYPIPDAQYVLTMRVRIEPGDSLAEVGAIAHPMFSELMMEAILAAGEEMFTGGESSVHRNNFQTWLPRYVKRDSMIRGTSRVRPRRSDRRLSREELFWRVNAGVQSSFPFDE
jgi:hypothetical protein